MSVLGLASISDYKEHLEDHPDEWAVLDAMCRITISRFYRDREVFGALRREVVPALAEAARVRGDRVIRVWSCGCASGEEPYTIAIAWIMEASRRFPDLRLDLLATDADPHMLERARRGVYAPASLRELPRSWVDSVFRPTGAGLQLPEAIRRAVSWKCLDVRTDPLDGPFDLVLCRNLVFTYYEEDLQRETLARLVDAMMPGAALAIGGHESLPDGESRLAPWGSLRAVYRRDAPSSG
jgi:chemotaxis protein methyltransferase CheR